MIPQFVDGSQCFRFLYTDSDGSNTICVPAEFLEYKGHVGENDKFFSLNYTGKCFCYQLESDSDSDSDGWNRNSDSD